MEKEEFKRRKAESDQKAGRLRRTSRPHRGQRQRAARVARHRDGAGPVSQFGLVVIVAGEDADLPQGQTPAFKIEAGDHFGAREFPGDLGRGTFLAAVGDVEGIATG